MGKHGNNCLDQNFVKALVRATAMFGTALTEESFASPGLQAGEIPGWDSLNRITFTMQLEKEYSLPEAALKFDDSCTLLELYDLIQKAKR